MEQQTTANEYQSEHKELYDYISKLSMKDLIELLNIIFYQDDINIDDYRFNESDQFSKLYINTLFKALNNREYEEDDNVIINNIKQALEGIHNNKLSYDDLNYDFSIKTEDERIIGISQNDNLEILLTRYNILSISHLLISIKHKDNLLLESLLNIIETKIKFKHVLEHIEDYYNKHLSEYKDDKFIIGELAKKFNLNFRIHTMNDKANKEELQRKDNDGWIIKCKPSQTKFEVAKLGNHYFTYEKLFIPRELIKDTNKLIAYFMSIDSFNINKLHKEDTIKQFIKDNKAKGNSINEDDYLISSLEFISILKKKQLLGYFMTDGNNKRIKELIYINDVINENGKLKFDVFIKAFEEIAKENIIDKYYKLFNNWLRL